MPRKILPAVVAAILVPALALAGIFSYRYARGLVDVASPAVWFEDPNVPNVRVRLDNWKTSAEVEVYSTARIERARRSAVYFDTFDENPFTTGKITATTCTWRYDAGARAVSISVGQRGPAEWGYSCIATVNLDVSAYAREGRRIYVAFLTWRSSFRDIRRLYDVAYYVDTLARRLYEVGFRVDLRSARTGDYLYSSIYYYYRGTWTALATSDLGISLTLEYDYLSNVGALVDFSEWVVEHWNVTRLSYASPAAGQRFYPDRVGFGFWIDSTTTGTVYYDNLVVSVDGAPWLVNVTGLPSGWVAVLKNSANEEVGRAVSEDGVAAIPVWAPRVDLQVRPGFRDGLVFPSATIEVYDIRGNLVAQERFDYVVGGDVYRLRYSYSGPILHVFSSTSMFWAKLVTTRASCSPRVNASLGLESWDGRATDTNVTIENGVLVVSKTSSIYVEPPAQWSSSWFALAVYVKSELPPASACDVEMAFEWWVSSGVVASYSIRLELKS
ncbi:MAG: hypothetical protein QXG82_06195 [Sulfolobales archaeon]